MLRLLIKKKMKKEVIVMTEKEGVSEAENDEKEEDKKDKCFIDCFRVYV